MCFVMPCRAESCLVDPLCKCELTRHGMTRHRFFGCVNESEPKWAVLALKNLHLRTSSLVFCPESNVCKLERCEHILACGNLMGNVRLRAQSFICAGFFLTSVMDYSGRNRKQDSYACCRLLCSEL